MAEEASKDSASTLQYKRVSLEESNHIDQKLRSILAEFDIRFSDQIIFLAGLESQRSALAKTMGMAEKELYTLVGLLQTELIRAQDSTAQSDAVKQFIEQAAKPSKLPDYIAKRAYLKFPDYRPDYEESVVWKFPDYNRDYEDEDFKYPDYKWAYEEKREEENARS
jgi:hypothetical protein